MVKTLSSVFAEFASFCSQRGDLAHEVVVDSVDIERSGATVGQRLLVPGHQAPGEVALGRADRARDLLVELDGQIGGATGRDVGCNIDLAPTDDAHVDHALAGCGIEPRVGRGQPGALEGVHQVGERLALVDPAQELPDGAEVVDVVDQRGSGQGHQQRTGGAEPDALGKVEDMLRPLRVLVLDEVRLVDDHAVEPEVAEPSDMAIEDLVVDDDDVGEAVDGVTVSVHDGGLAVRRPHVGLARPVGLHHARHDDQHRVGVRGFGGEQRLSRLAQARLVREQECSVARRRGGDHSRLVRHQLTVCRQADRARWRQGHARTGPALGAFEGAQERVEQLPSDESARGHRAGTGRREVRRKERVRELSRHDRLRHDAPLGRGRIDRLGAHRLFRRRLDPGGLLHGAGERLRRIRDDRVGRQELEQAGVTHRGLREDGRDPVQALLLLGPVGLTGGLIQLDPRMFFAHAQRNGLELRAHRGCHALPPDSCLDLTNREGKPGDDVLRALRALGL